MTATAPFLDYGDGLCVVPMVRGSLPFALEARRAVDELAPAGMALELPGALTRAITLLVRGLPRIRRLSWQPASGQALFLAADPGDATIEAMRLSLERGIPAELVDGLEGRSQLGPEPPMPDAEALSVLGLEAFAAPAVNALLAKDGGVEARDWRVARRVLAALEQARPLLAVVSFPVAAALRRAHRDGVTPLVEKRPELPRHRIELLAEDALGYAVREMPDLLARWEAHRRAFPRERFPIRRAIEDLLHDVADQYEKERERKVNLTERRALRQFARNLALRRGGLLPDFEELVIAARGCVDDDYAHLLFQRAVSYPANRIRRMTSLDDIANLFISKLTQREPQVTYKPRHRSLSLYTELDGQMLRTEPAYPIGSVREVSFTFRRRLSEAERLRDQLLFQRLQVMHPPGICSWPPEDFRLEAFLRQVQQRAMTTLRELHTAQGPFVNSLEDGVDLRETLRERVHGRDRVVVRRRLPPRGRVGPVLIVWEDAPVTRPNLWLTTLYAENQNESDIAVALERDLAAGMVGPGIARYRYHAILAFFPPGGTPDLMGNRRFLREWGTISRALTAAAILLSKERYVAVLSTRRPDRDLLALAREAGRTIIHLPLKAFSTPRLDRIRTMHILAHRGVREWADGYIDP